MSDILKMLQHIIENIVGNNFRSECTVRYLDLWIFLFLLAL